MAVDQDIQDSPDVGTPPAPPQTDPVEKYYNYLKSAGADVAPNLDSFKKTLSNDSTAQKYYNYLRQNKFDTPPTYGSFARTLGITQATTPETTLGYQTHRNGHRSPKPAKTAPLDFGHRNAPRRPKPAEGGQNPRNGTDAKTTRIGNRNRETGLGGHSPRNGPGRPQPQKQP